MNDYYVYVYIDPRNFEEFYYGEGKGSRKDAHLRDQTDTEKSKRINVIKKEGLKPIIRVIARGLTKQEAKLVEKTLLWRLGKRLDNKSGGYFKKKFRPVDTFHKELSGFDFKNALYYYNVGEGPYRNWDDYRKFGFISAGHGPRYRDAMLGFNKDDIIVAYLKRHGFVGVGRIIQTAKMINDVRLCGKPLLSYKLKCKGMADNSDNPEKSEYVALVEWLKAVPRGEAKWRNNLFAIQLVRASLDNQPSTVKFIEEHFRVNIKDLHI